MAESMLVERLARLEKKTRRIQGMALAALILCAVGLFISVPRWTLGTPPQGERTVEAEQFELKDANGTTRALLQMGPHGPEFSLIDANGNPLVSLVAGTTASGLLIRNSVGTARAALLSVGAGQGQPDLALMDEKGRQRTLLTITENGPAISMRDPNGEGRIELHVGSDGPSQHFYDADGQTVLALAALASGTTVGIKGGEREAAAELTVTKDTGPRLLLLNNEGKPIYSRP